MTAAARYSEMMGGRNMFLKRAREFSRWTIPALLSPTGAVMVLGTLTHDWQSDGAMGVPKMEYLLGSQSHVFIHKFGISAQNGFVFIISVKQFISR